MHEIFLPLNNREGELFKYIIGAYIQFLQWIQLLVVIFMLTESWVACVYLHRDGQFQEWHVERWTMGGINKLFVVWRPDACLHQVDEKNKRLVNQCVNIKVNWSASKYHQGLISTYLCQWPCACVYVKSMATVY